MALQKVEVASVELRELEVTSPREISTADLWLPVDGARPLPLVLLGHGGGYPHLGRREPRLRLLAERLATEMPAAVLVIDGPAHGDRSPADVQTARRLLVLPDTPVWFAEEWRCATEAAAAQAEVDGSACGYIGFSMGTLLGVPSVAANPHVRAAVFGLGGVPRQGGVGALARKFGAPEAVAKVVDAEDDAEHRGRVLLEAASRLGDRQVLLLNMTEDEVIPVDGGLQLLNAIPGQARMAVFRGGHMELPAEALDLAVWFLRRALRGDPGDSRPMGAW